ncbi:MAG: class I SAM-dependent rRNA methyltransferase [Rhodothermales bacterium]
MPVTLRPRQEKHVLKGYPWIFSNQIDAVDEAATGDIVDVRTADGRPLGQGFYHAKSLIAVRLVTTDVATPVDEAFFARRIDAALALRSSFFHDATHYRLIFSESDGFPGTIVDRYGDVLTWSCLSYGMEKQRDLVLDLLEERLKPAAIVERNDTWLRGKDGLPECKGVIRGAYEGPIRIRENGIAFDVDVTDGPKTGFFIDQRLHRAFVGRLARGRSVLDVFCADGGFSLHAAAGGAASVLGLDTSESALARAAHNAQMNDVSHCIEYKACDALDELDLLREQGRTFDLIVLDPPAFAKSRKHLEAATRAYQRINITAMQLLNPGGILATASCSHAIDEKDFLKIVRYSAIKSGTTLRTLHHGCQPPDHPVLDAMPETSYLKFEVVQKMEG